MKTYRPLPSTCRLLGRALLAAALIFGACGGCKRAPPPPPEPVAPPAPPKPRTLQAVQRWSVDVPGAAALCVGDWDGDQAADILVADSTPKLIVLGARGNLKGSFPLPDRFTAIECGRHRDQGSRLLGYSGIGKEVRVLDNAGKELWSYPSSTVVNGAHWGDLDGDGSDELVVGMSGFGGIHAVSPDGKLIWQYKNIGDVWNLAVIPATPARTALVYATESRGAIRELDGSGTRLRAFHPENLFCAQLSAAVIDASNTVQVITVGQAREGLVIAMDERGTNVWKMPCPTDRSAWRTTSFASGDIDGDGVREWAFLGAPGKLVIVTARGDAIASVAIGENPCGFAIVPAADGSLLVTCDSDKIIAYAFE